MLKKLLIISKWQQHNLKPRLGPSNMGLCHKLQGSVPMKLALTPCCCYAFRVLTTAVRMGDVLPLNCELLQNSLIHFTFLHHHTYI